MALIKIDFIAFLKIKNKKPLKRFKTIDKTWCIVQNEAFGSAAFCAN
jgi:hypothetical protein